CWVSMICRVVYGIRAKSTQGTGPRLPSNASASCSSFNRNPVAAQRLLQIRPTDDAFENAAVFFDRPDRPDVVIVARHENATNAKLVAGDLNREAENGSSVAPPAELRHNDVADVAAHTLEKLIERNLGDVAR